MIAPLDPAEIGPDQSRVKGRDTEPSVPHTSSYTCLQVRRTKNKVDRHY